MTQTIIPGFCARHSIVTDRCRILHGDDHAAEVALGHLRDSYKEAANGWGVDKGVSMHFVLVIERPQHDKVDVDVPIGKEVSIQNKESTNE